VTGRSTQLWRAAKKKVPFAVRRSLDPYFNLERFFVDALRYQWEVKDRTDFESTWGAYYEFGVGEMTSLLAYWRAYRRLVQPLGLPDPVIRGFDTFTGLPRSEHPSDQLEGWTPGRFAMSLGECQARVRRVGIPGVEFIEGRYEDTLTPELAQKLTDDPPAIVNLDVDFYTSTAAALRFLVPMFRPGVLVHFDDVWSFNGDPTRGQLRAIDEFNATGPFYLAPHWLGMGSGHVYSVSKPMQLD